MSGVFGLFESNAFAKAFAEDSGIKVRQHKEAIEPHISDRHTIEIGTPTIYGHDRYVQQLHSEISKVLPEVQFFHDLQLEDTSVHKIMKDILLAQRSEYAMHNEYEGRDRILKERYAQRLDAAGGIQRITQSLAPTSPTAAAMMYLDNELRNEWQGYNYADEPIPEIAGEVERLRPILEDKWLTLKDRQSLETLLKTICDEPMQMKAQGGKGDGKEDKKGDKDERSKESGEPSERGDKGDPGDAGDKPDNSEGDSESGDGDCSEDSESGDDSADSGGDDGTEGSDDQSSEQSNSDSGEDNKSATPAQCVDPKELKKKMGSTDLIQDAAKMSDRDFKPDHRKYVPDDRQDLRDITRDQRVRSDLRDRIETTLGSFALSKKMRKYLITLSQVGYEYGLKKGRLCSKHVGRIYTGTQQPRIFKQKQAARIQTDTAIFVLGDTSGSMSGRKYHTSAACQVATSETLQTLRIPHMMGQFASDHGVLYHMIMKKFDEHFVSRDTLLDRYSDNRIYSGNNADGEAVIWAATELAKRKEKNKILIVLSDGQPAHKGGDSTFLKDVVNDIIKNSDMKLMGIGIQSSAVERYYPLSRVVNKVEDLESVLMSLLKDNILA